MRQVTAHLVSELTGRFGALPGEIVAGIAPSAGPCCYEVGPEVLAAARELPDVTFLVNGNGAARPSLEAAAADIANVRFADYIEPERLSESLPSDPSSRGLSESLCSCSWLLRLPGWP